MMAFAPGTVFRPRDSSRMSVEQAARYGPELANLQDRMGRLEPEILVDEARPKSSPLHDWFEWDTKKAAHKHHLEQARYLLRSIEIVYKDADQVERTTKGFHNVTVMVAGTPSQVYLSTPVIFSKPDLRSQVIAQAYSELQRWKIRYAEYKELAEFFKPVLEAIEKIVPPQ